MVHLGEECLAKRNKRGFVSPSLPSFIVFCSSFLNRGFDGRYNVHFNGLPGEANSALLGVCLKLCNGHRLQSRPASGSAARAAAAGASRALHAFGSPSGP